MLDVDRLLAELTVPEKAALTSGSSFWYTTAVDRLGIPKIMVSDGPHGLRARAADAWRRQTTKT
jgi:beta-glucosidase